MNIITANFVQHAILQAEEVKDVSKMCDARNLFRSLDVDEHGLISIDKIRLELESPTVQQFFRSLDVDISEAQCLFEILDFSGDGAIDFEEFLNGCLHLQGQAKALDLLLMTRETRKSFAKQESLMQSIHSDLRKTIRKTVVGTGAVENHPRFDSASFEA